jgi:hypothetical protein
MPAVESVRKQVVKDLISYGNIPNVRTIDFIVDFDEVEADLASGDHLNLVTLPKGTVVLAASVEQVKAGAGATSTLVARVGSTTMSGTLLGNAAVGTVAANAAVDTQVLTADTDLNILAGVAAREAGMVRVFAVVIEGRVPQIRQIVKRDALT